MAEKLNGRTVAILLAPAGTEQVEFERPRSAVEQAGGTVEVVGLETGEARTVNSDLEPGDLFSVDRTVSEARADDYDAVIVPGGTVGADNLRASPEAVAFVRGFFDQGKPVGAICHGPWVLVEAGVVDGRTLTSYPSLQTDVRNAGGTWIDEEVVEDGQLVTSRNPGHLPAFCAAIVRILATG